MISNFTVIYNMKHNIYLLLALLGLALECTGCSEESPLDKTSAGSGIYDSRLITRLQISTENIIGDEAFHTRGNNGNVVLQDIWYLIFDANTGNILASANGEKTHHRIIADNQLDPIEEQLPEGEYILTFLIMSAGGDANAVQTVKSLKDQWLKAGTDGTVDGDFFYGQGRTTVTKKQTNTLNVTMERVSGLLEVDTKMMDDSQKELLRKIVFIPNNPLPYAAMTAGGDMIAENSDNSKSIDMTTKGGHLFALVSTDAPVACDGKLLLTLSDGENNHQRLYQTEGVKLERTKRSSYTLNLNLPFNRLGSLDQSSVTSREQMFATGETVQKIISRQFQLNKPLKVTFSANAASVQFFSPVGIGYTEIYARIKTTRDYFKVYELDTIRPFDELSLRSTLLNNEEGYYLTESGRILRIPAGNNLTNDELEYKVVCQSEHWKKLEKIQLDPTIGFFDGTPMGDDGVAYNMKNTLTPKRARTIVGMLLNWGVMLNSPVFECALDEWPSPKLDTEGKAHKEFYWPDMNTKEPVYVSKEEIRTRLREFFGKGHIDFAVHTHQEDGVWSVGVVIPKTKYDVYSLWDEVYDTAYTPYIGYGYVPYHELAHLMGYPDNYGCGENTMASMGFTGWTDLCAMVFRDMSSRNELPVSSKEIFETLDY